MAALALRMNPCLPKLPTPIKIAPSLFCEIIKTINPSTNSKNIHSNAAFSWVTK